MGRDPDPSQNPNETQNQIVLVEKSRKNIFLGQKKVLKLLKNFFFIFHVFFRPNQQTLDPIKFWVETQTQAQI